MSSYKKICEPVEIGVSDVSPCISAGISVEAHFKVEGDDEPMIYVWQRDSRERVYFEEEVEKDGEKYKETKWVWQSGNAENIYCILFGGRVRYTDSKNLHGKMINMSTLLDVLRDASALYASFYRETLPDPYDPKTVWDFAHMQNGANSIASGSSMNEEFVHTVHNEKKGNRWSPDDDEFWMQKTH